MFNVGFLAIGDEMSARCRVVVIGAGYAGVMAANRLAGKTHFPDVVSVTVVNPVADFVERIRLHEVAAGSRASAAVPMRSVLHPDVEVVEDTAFRIDPDNRRVHFSSGRAPLDYDVLLYSVGSTQAGAQGPAGASGLRDTESASRLRAGLSQLDDGAAVNVIGAGLTGIELSAEIAEQYPRLRVSLISRGVIGENLSDSGRRALRKRLSAMGVKMVENTDVQKCDDASVTTSTGAALRSNCTIWAAGFGAPGLARDSGLPTDAEGRLIVDESLSCPQYPEIFGAGDAVRAPDSVAGHLRMGCAAALPLGAHAADSIIARLRNRRPAALSAGYAVWCISLGRRSGLIQTVTAADRPRSLAVSGPLAGLAKEQVSRMTLSWIRGELRRSGSYKWPKGPLTVEAR